MGDGSKKSIYEYDDYREFLRDTFTLRKQKDKKFSFRFFSRVAGFQAHSFAILVLQGKADLSSESAEKFAAALKLNKEETQFFKSLVLFNQAKTAEGKNHLAKKLIRSRAYRKLHPLSEAQFNCLTQWYFLPIRELTNLANFKEDPEWIAKKLTPPISSTDAKKALDELLKLGLLQRDPNGHLSPTHADVSTGDEVVSSAVATYHREILNRAGESIDNVPRERRDISAMVLGMSDDAAKKVKEMIQEFRKEIVEVISQDSGRPSSVYQLGFQLFPVTKEEKSK